MEILPFTGFSCFFFVCVCLFFLIITLLPTEFLLDFTFIFVYVISTTNPL